MRLMMIGLAALCLIFAPAQAADKKSEAVPGPETIEFVNLPLPVVRNGRLENYLFATVSVELTPSADADALRRRAHIVRDSFLRAAHDTSVSLADDPFSLDPVSAATTLRAVAQSGFGAKAVRELKIVTWTSLRTRTTPGRSQSAAADVAPH